MANQLFATIGAPSVAANTTVQRGSHYFTQPTSGTWMNPQTNVVWQDTSSNATYCSASAALGNRS